MMKLHYFMFSYAAANGTFARVTMGWPDKYVNEGRIREARNAVLGGANACPIAVSYLGEMTREEAVS
ncbi:hypothetical protein [Agrobacterium pusense]|uniref:Uncharacterized protein n=1 Tax=Agrobacterium pusense TaxID=648995 RepID=A0AA44ERN8_9HYPH|nr:hypothetical protein [Agrobacterium pusense]NRF12522.1 hypothetical protein [Agrobacterium pusense]NRF23233.1 hypothetical protein [Agrobacterium pusense]